MILDCPECRSRYLVPDSAIGTEGRAVRCANCRHSWFQAKNVAPADAPSPVLPSADAPGETPIAITDTPEAPSREPAADKPGMATTATDVATPTVPTSVPDPVEEPAAVLARRSPARRWALVAVVAGLLLIAGSAAILWTNAPGLLQRLGIPIGPAESPLRLVDNPIERRDLSNGSELFAVSGKVLNPSASRQRVPDIRADLRDASGRIVFSWRITPQQRTLGPGTAIDFNSAKLDVPANSKRLELSFVGEEG